MLERKKERKKDRQTDRKKETKKERKKVQFLISTKLTQHRKKRSL
jgi:hypothetical protein